MGQDRLKQAKDRARRAWDSARASLFASDLFSRQATLVERSFIAVLKAGANATAGEKLLLHSTEEGALLTRSNNAVGNCIEVPGEMLDRIQGQGGTICVEVLAVNTMSRTLEVALNDQEADEQDQ